jgi:hypothetical protein
LGQAELESARAPVAFMLAPQATRVLRFRLTAAALRGLRRSGRVSLALMTTNVDTAGGTPAAIRLAVLRPRALRSRS